MTAMAAREPNRHETDLAPLAAIHALEEGRDRRALRWAALAAALAHLSLLLLRLPGDEVERIAAATRVPFVVTDVDFEPPPPEPAPPVPETPIRTIPVPDPTPEDLEPIALEPIELPEEVSPVDIRPALPAPPAPPAPAPPPEPEGPVYLVGDMTPPVKIHAPPPRYPELARKVRQQGVVILQAVIDERGDVTDIRVLKGLPMGLDDAAVDAIRRWRFEPATLADGRPVAVYYTLTVKFELR